MTATVKVLAVTKTAICDPKWKNAAGETQEYDVIAAPDVCPNPNTDYPDVRAEDKIELMGFGFGRQQDGQPQGTPEKNPMLKMATIGGAPVNALTYRPGYVVSKQGINVGITNTNAGTGGQNRFVYVSLKPHWA
ncbi:hypothetical protein FNYG_15125 [Fusarium nygamai]|uniref:Uncharacterized protein n=1 Tax=Gibberella nygamai TaxID=42673 RepID=A0A2K0UKU0_GIBNY|nr:hypothetical protein FNYG_15125 [Fusarium nygamai]